MIRFPASRSLEVKYQQLSAFSFPEMKLLRICQRSSISGLQGLSLQAEAAVDHLNPGLPPHP